MEMYLLQRGRLLRAGVETQTKLKYLFWRDALYSITDDIIDFVGKI